MIRWYTKLKQVWAVVKVAQLNSWPASFKQLLIMSGLKKNKDAKLRHALIEKSDFQEGLSLGTNKWFKFVAVETQNWEPARNLCS